MLKIIAISGAQGSGKTTLANNLIEQLGASVVTVTKFAEPLYDMVDALKPIIEPIIGPLTKNNYADFMQFAGDWLRSIDKDFFVKNMKAKINFLSEEENTVMIVDDLRFPNELEMLKDSGALLVRLECPIDVRRKRAEKWRSNTTHQSEVALDDKLHHFDKIFDSERMTPEDITTLTLQKFRVTLNG